MGSAEVGGKIFLTTNVLLKYEKVRISVKKDNNELMEHFFKLHSKWSQNAITVREELAMQYRSLEKAMKMDSTALMEHFLSLLIGESSTVKEEYPDESLDSLTSQPTQSVSIGEASTPPVMEYHNTSLSQDGSTSASPRNLVQIRDTALCSTSSNAAIKNPGALYTNNQSSCVPTVHIPLDSGVLLPHLSGTSSFSHTFSQKRKLSSSSDGDVPASKIPGIQHHIHHLHPPQSSGEPLQQESIPDRRSLIEGTTGQHLFGYQTGSTRNDYGKPSATFSLQDVEQQQNHGLRTAALPSDLSKDSRRDISKTALDFIEGVSQVTSVDNVHSLRLSVDRVSMGSIVGSEPLERQNVLGMNMSPQFAKGLRQNRVSMDNSVNIHPQPGTSGVNQNISGSMTEFDLSAVKIEINSDEDLEDVSHESGDQEALAAMVTDADCRTFEEHASDLGLSTDVTELKPKSTGRMTRWARTKFEEWLIHEEGVAVNFSMTPVQLGQYLTRFYAEIKAKDGRPFTKNALRGMRAGLQRAFRAPPYNMNNVNLTMDSPFQTANEVFEKRCNYFSSLENHPPILNEDLVKLAFYLNPYESPVKLLHTVWFLLCYYFDQQGRDRLRESSKQSFRIALDASGQLFLAMVKEGHGDQSGVSAAKIAYGIHPKDDTKSLPTIFRFYLSKLNPGCDALFQRPRQFRTMREMEESAVWFERIPVGAKAIGYLMTLISEKANLSKLYTIYSVRATSHTIAAISRFPRYSKMHPHPLNINLSHS